MKPSLSVIIITKNASATIEKCLLSVLFAKEIIVLDCGSTDDTVSICRKYTNCVFQTDWPGFGIQKNRALEKATSDWVFSIDSDEWASDELRNEILKVIEDSKHVLFKIKRRNRYCGCWIRFGDVGANYVTRLFKKGSAHFNNDIVHEKLISKSKPKKLKSLLMHDAYPTIASLLQRVDLYTTLTAEKRFAQNKKTFFARAIASSLGSFLKAYIFRFGFLDGKMGFIVAVAFAQSSFYRHVKLLELQQSL